MDRKLCKDAIYSPEIGKLMITLNYGKIHFKVIEPYVATFSVCNETDARDLLAHLGLADLPLTVLEDRHTPKAQHETAHGLLKSIGGWGGEEVNSFTSPSLEQALLN